MNKYHEALNQISERINQRISPRLLADAKFKKLKGHLDVMARALNSIATARADRVATPEARRDKIKSATAAAFDMVSKARGEVKEEAAKAEESFQETLKGKTDWRPSKFAAEIRAKFASLGVGERVNFLQEWIKEADAQSMAAVIDSPTILTGLKREDKQKFSGQFFETHAPDIMRTKRAYGDLVEHISAALSTVENAATESESEAE